MSEVVDRLNAALAGRFRLERELGRGGMAAVFLAEDLKHRRRVAIKVLHPELTAFIGPERFIREIEIAARLQHPHILTLLDSGAAGGLLYYVMPYVEGESLRERLVRERQLPVEDALLLAREVADALDYAHREGVVHRDIKPENILLQAGHAVVVDFGIARAIAAAGGENLTTTGTVLGTPAYMSPEQVVGSADLDGRSDVYSLACVLYEMLAGLPPFAGVTSVSLAHHHLSVEPPPVTSARPAVPKAAARALAKALAKAPADRFRTAAELAEALRPPMEASKPATAARGRRPMILAAVAAATMLTALAVWRFGPALLGGRPPDPAKKAWILVADFDGPAADSSVVTATRDLVIAALEQSEIVATVPRDQIRRALQSAGKPTSTRVDGDLARELAYRSAVRTVLEGHIGRLGKGYSVVLRLVDADSARVVLSVSDEARDEGTLIPTVDRIAKRLRTGLGERRGAIQGTHELIRVTTPSFEAYRAYVRGRDLLLAGDNRAAITVLRSALALDPNFAVAWGTMHFCYINLDEPDSALAVIRQALARPERLPERGRLMAEASVAILSGDVAGALAANERALQLYPQSASAYDNRSAYLSWAGRLTEALESARAAERVSPFGPSQTTLDNQFWCLLLLGRVEEARTLAPRFSGRFALEAPMDVAEAAGLWPAAESVATALRGNPTVDDDLRRRAAAVLAAVQASRGEVRTAGQTLREAQSVAEAAREMTRANWTRWDRLRLALFSRGAAADPGDPGHWDSTTTGLVAHGVWAAAVGDTTSARGLLAAIRKRSPLDLVRQGFFGPTMVDGWIAARAGRWNDVVRLLGPAALQGEATGYALVQSAPLVRWLVADAYEHLDRPDSAAAYFERAIAPPPPGGSNFEQSRMAFSFGHRRLVLLYARMGRPEDARRHWEVFSRTFTRPDPEMVPMVREAQAALASAEAMEKSARR